MRLLIILLAFCSLMFSACFDITEDLVLEKDGSGVYTYTTDMSELYKNEMMMSMLKADGKDGKNPLPDMDSVIYGKDMAAKDKGEQPEIWNKVTTRIQANEKQKKLMITIKLSFSDLSEITYLMKNLNKATKGMNNEEGASETSGLTGVMNGIPVSYALKGKTLERVSEKIEQEDDEQMSMMKMFLADAKYTVVYHLPGKVKSTSVKGAVMDGNTLTKEAKLMDMMEGQRPFDGTIKFK